MTARQRLRRDVVRWAREVGFTPQMSLDDPDTLLEFIGNCIERFPGFTHAHGREIFAWCREKGSRGTVRECDMSPTLPNLFMMPWFPRDFLASTRGWSLISRAIYRELLDAQWEQGGLSADPSELRDLVGATPVEWRAGWPRVAPKFAVGTDGLLRNARLEEHRQKAIRIALKRAEVGREGGLESAKQRRAIGQAIASSSGEQLVKQRSTINTTQASRRLTKAAGESLRSAEVGLTLGERRS